MKTSRFSVVGVTFLCLSVAVFKARAADHEIKGTLSGMVIGPDGRAVAGATVFLDDYDYDAANFKPIVKTVSAADGSFRLESIDPVFQSHNELRVIASGFAPQYVPSGTFSVVGGAHTSVGTIRLTEGQVLSGQVLDVDGTPRSGAVVECEARRYVSAFASPLTPTYKITTDPQGRFETPRLPVSFAGITVRVSGRRMPWVRVAVGAEGRKEIGAIHLEPGVPIEGFVHDEHGQPISGLKVGAYSSEYGTAWLTSDTPVTDSNGRFTLQGFGPNSKFQMQISDPGHVGINWVVRGSADGLRWDDVRAWIAAKGKPDTLKGPAAGFDIAMKSVAWVDGRAIDAMDGKPVHLDQVVMCNFDRKPTGELVLNGCQSTQFHQDADGMFHVPYSVPDEYHLTFSAAGYQDAEAFTPMVKTLQPISGIDVKMHRLRDGAGPKNPKQTIAGTITRDGRPVKNGWVGLLMIGHERDRLNVGVVRGRTVAVSSGARASAPIVDGAYTLDVPFQADNWRVVVEEPAQAPTEASPISVGLNERKKLDIACTEGGGISGRVESIPQAWASETWVTAFTKTGLHFETRVGGDGTFSFRHLPPGEYGLKAGNDAMRDSELPPEIIPDGEYAKYEGPAEPWKAATICKVESGRDSTSVRVKFPEN